MSISNQALPTNSFWSIGNAVGPASIVLTKVLHDWLLDPRSAWEQVCVITLPCDHNVGFPLFFSQSSYQSRKTTWGPVETGRTLHWSSAAERRTSLWGLVGPAVLVEHTHRGPLINSQNPTHNLVLVRTFIDILLSTALTLTISNPLTYCRPRPSLNLKPGLGSCEDKISQKCRHVAQVTLPSAWAASHWRVGCVFFDSWSFEISQLCPCSSSAVGSVCAKVADDTASGGSAISIGGGGASKTTPTAHMCTTFIRHGVKLINHRCWDVAVVISS